MDVSLDELIATKKQVTKTKKTAVKKKNPASPPPSKSGGKPRSHLAPAAVSSTAAPPKIAAPIIVQSPSSSRRNRRPGRVVESTMSDGGRRFDDTPRVGGGLLGDRGSTSRGPAPRYQTGALLSSKEIEQACKIKVITQLDRVPSAQGALRRHIREATDRPVRSSIENGEQRLSSRFR